VDRTKEFEDILTFFSPNKTLPPKVINDSETTDFAAALASIAAQFEQTQRHVEKLQRLVDQRSSFYKEPTADIEALSLLFDSDDKQIEGQLQLLSIWLTRNTISRSQSRKHGETILETLKTRRTQFAQHFQSSLKKRTEVLKRKVRRQSQFGTESTRRRELTMGSPLFTFPNQQAPSQHREEEEEVKKDMINSNHDNEIKKKNVGHTTDNGVNEKTFKTKNNQPTSHNPYPASQNYGSGSGSGSNNGGGGSVRRRRHGGQSQQMSQMLLQEEEEDQEQKQLGNALKRRSTARGIESEIEKLGEVFQRFSALVSEQGEALKLIDEDVEAALEEVEEGQVHIAKTYSITQGNRGVILKVFATVIVLGVILVVT